MSGSPVKPIAPAGRVLSKLGPGRAAQLMISYYDACKSYNDALICEKGSSTEPSELTSDGSVESQLPKSDVSVGSSASTGKARKRARWRANRKAARLAKSDITYSLPPVDPLSRKPGVSGTCYLSLVQVSERERVGKELGSCPTFRAIFNLPAGVVVSETVGLCVARVSPGMYHLGALGYAVDVAMVSVAVKAAVAGYVPVVGSYGESLLRYRSRARHVDKAPEVDDRLGQDPFGVEQYLGLGSVNGTAPPGVFGGTPDSPYGPFPWVPKPSLVGEKAAFVVGDRCDLCTAIEDVRTLPASWQSVIFGRFGDYGETQVVGRLCQRDDQVYDVKVGETTVVMRIMGSLDAKDVFISTLSSMWCERCKASAVGCQCPLSNKYLLIYKRLSGMTALRCQGWCESRLGVRATVKLAVRIARLVLERGTDPVRLV